MKRIFRGILFSLIAVLLFTSCRANKKYEVTFVTGTEQGIIKEKYSVLNKPDFDLSNEGYILSGWYFDLAYTNPITYPYILKENIIIYAKWDLIQYVIKFESNGGTTIEDIKVSYNEGITLPTSPVKDGYTFEGWYYDASFKEVAKDGDIITRNTILYAKWVENIYYNVIFLNGTEEYENVSVQKGLKVEKPTDPVKSGYVFVCWSLSETEKQEYDFETAIRDNLTLYSWWVEGSINEPTQSENLTQEEEPTEDEITQVEVIWDIQASVDSLNASIGIEKLTLEAIVYTFQNKFIVESNGKTYFQKGYLNTQGCDVKFILNGEENTNSFTLTAIYSSSDKGVVEIKNIETNKVVYEISAENNDEIEVTLNNLPSGTYVIDATKADGKGASIKITSLSVSGLYDQEEQVPGGSEVEKPNEEATLDYIYVSGLNTTYYLEENFDLSKVQVRAYYSDGTYVLLDKDDYIIDIADVNKSVAGTYKIYISYADEEKVMSVTYKEKPTSDSGLGDTTTGEIINVGSITTTESSGHLEAAYIEWSPVDNIETYHVYYKDKDDSVMSYKKLDMMLIRKYSDYYRADVVGVAAGEYNVKVICVHNNEEVGDFTEVTLKVGSHDRSGFAFSANSEYKDASGAYNPDGTLKSGAQVIYVHAGNAKTVTATVNGIKVTGFQAILDAKAKKNTSNDILCFRIIGTVSKSDLDKISSSAIGLQVKGNSANTNMNITIEGIGEDATFNGFGILIRNSGNVEIRNIGFVNFMDDGISVDTDNCNLWMHNNDFFYGSGGSGDKAKGDGSLDIKKSHYCTVSYNHFWDSGKCNLLDASTGSGSDYMSYHHNWFDHSDSRHPRVRNASSVHVYNNYFDGVAKYGIGAAGGGSSIFSEANYFRNSLHPYLSSKQGTDALGEGTFSGEDGGIIKAYGDVIVDGNPVITYQENSTSFDIYLAEDRNETLSSSIKSKSGGFTYSNFDTASTMYSYNVQTAEDAKDTVMMYAGRINQGDLQYDFIDTKEDKNYDIIPELKSMVTNYKSSLVSILGAKDYAGSNGGSSSGGNSETITPDDNINNDNNQNNQPSVEGAVVHNFTIDGLTSSVFAISGNLSTSKGSVTYNGLSLDQCLKMEGETTITFTIDSEYTLILVFGGSTSASGKKVKVDGTSYTADSNNLATIELKAGTYTITKGDSINLFYIVLNPKE